MCNARTRHVDLKEGIVKVYLSCRTLLAIQNDIKNGSSSGVKVLWSVVSLGLQVAAQSRNNVRETSLRQTG